MQEDFHYYATYSAAILAGYSHEESMAVCYSAQFVDWCSKTLLSKIGAPGEAATTQLQLEMMDMALDRADLKEITSIWASFHFLPYDIYADVKGAKRYQEKYRLICNSNGDLLIKTVDLAKNNTIQAVGIAMHVLADTWAHKNFAGTPSLVINNMSDHAYELIPGDDGFEEKKITFRHNPQQKDDIENGFYTNTIFQNTEKSIMVLGHGRAGHLPDYSFIRYKYLPAWGGYKDIIKDNPEDYYKAYCQMIYALKYLKDNGGAFEKNEYDFDAVKPYAREIRKILEERKLENCSGWKEFGEKLSGKTIEDFSIEKHQEEYINAGQDDRAHTFLGEFISAAIAQKQMVSEDIKISGNRIFNK